MYTSARLTTTVHTPSLLRRLACADGLGVAAVVATLFIPRALAAQTSAENLQVCIVPGSGTVYATGETGTPNACTRPTHLQRPIPLGPLVRSINGLANQVVLAAGDNVTITPAGQTLTISASGGIADHGALTGLGDDDHPQYLRADGTRALTGNLSAGGFKITNLAAGAAAGDAVRFEQAVKQGDAAGGDLAGAYPNPTVDGLHGRAVASTAPTTGEVLAWDGTAWAPAADQGVSGHQISNAEFAAPAGTESTFEHHCPTGKRALGGGFAVFSNSVFVRWSVPLNVGTGWQVSVMNSATTSQSVEIHVVCATVQ